MGKKMSLHNIVSETAKEYGLTYEILIERPRTRLACDARHTAMLIAYKCGGLSIMEIARRMKRTHATIKYAIEHCEYHIRRESNLREHYTNIIDRLSKL